MVMSLHYDVAYEFPTRSRPLLPDTSTTRHLSINDIKLQSFPSSFTSENLAKDKFFERKNVFSPENG
jgi:hypothetical protein